MEFLEAFVKEFRELRKGQEDLRRELQELRLQVAKPPAPELLTVEAFCERYGWRVGTVRAKIFDKDTNGLAHAIHQERPGCRVFIDAAAFLSVVQSWGRRRR